MLASVALLALLAGCHEDMWIQPKVKAMQESDFYPDGMSMRPLAPHTVDRTHFWTDLGRYTGYNANGKLVTRFPIRITLADLKRGQQRFNIFCSPCHGALGKGDGMIAMRGLALRKQPASYHTDRLRKMPIGHFYDVITNGYGVMFSYASRIEPDDRWRIVAYIRALQRSQDAKPSDVLPKGWTQINAGLPAPATSITASQGTQEQPQAGAPTQGPFTGTSARTAATHGSKPNGQ